MEYLVTGTWLQNTLQLGVMVESIVDLLFAKLLTLWEPVGLCAIVHENVVFGGELVLKRPALRSTPNSAFSERSEDGRQDWERPHGPEFQRDSGTRRRWSGEDDIWDQRLWGEKRETGGRAEDRVISR